MERLWHATIAYGGQLSEMPISARRGTSGPVSSRQRICRPASGAITDEDLARTGENDVEALRRRAAHAGPIGHDTLLYRVELPVARQPDDD
jgi:hypothetical protein